MLALLSMRFKAPAVVKANKFGAVRTPASQLTFERVGGFER